MDDLFRDIDRNFEKPHQVPNFVPGGPMMDQGVQGSERAIVETLSMITRAQGMHTMLTLRVCTPIRIHRQPALTLPQTTCTGSRRARWRRLVSA